MKEKLIILLGGQAVRGRVYAKLGMLWTTVIFIHFKGRTAWHILDCTGCFSYTREYKMEFAELPGSSPCLLTPSSTREQCLFQPLPSWPQFQTAVTGIQRTYSCALAKGFFSLFFSQSEFTIKFLGCNTDTLPVFRTWDAPSSLQCATPEQGDIFQWQKEEWGGFGCRDC